MHRKTPQERCERVKDLDGTELRRKCARFVADHAEEIAGARPEIPKDLNDRAADIWEPLLALSELAGGGWAERAREAAVALTAKAQEHSPMGALLFDILVCFLSHQAERLFSRTLVGALKGFEDRPWSELKRGKEATERWLAGQLRPYCVRPKTIWIGEEAAKGYLKEDFEDVFQRYIPKAQARLWLKELEATVVREKTGNGAEQEATKCTEVNGEGAGDRETGKAKDLKTAEEAGETGISVNC